MKIIFSTFIIFIALQVSAQSYEFYGVLLLNGKKDAPISYKIVFTENNGTLSGYSISDINGLHETKNKIGGKYNPDTKTISIQEKSIIYTKSKYKPESFCYVSFGLKVNLMSKNAKLEGPFQSKFANGSNCISGTLSLVGSALVQKLLTKSNKVIQKSKELSDDEKVKYNTKNIFDSLSVNQVVANETLTIYSQSSEVKFFIYDTKYSDDDRISLYHNDKLILSDHKVTVEGFEIGVKLLPGSNLFKLVANNQGTLGLNTAKIIVKGDSQIEFQSNLKTGESALVSIVR